MQAFQFGESVREPYRYLIIEPVTSLTSISSNCYLICLTEKDIEKANRQLWLCTIIFKKVVAHGNDGKHRRFKPQ